MNTTIRAHFLGITPTHETARQFQIKIFISLLIISMATASLLWQDTWNRYHPGKTTAEILKQKSRRAGRKLKSLFE